MSKPDLTPPTAEEVADLLHVAEVCLRPSESLVFRRLVAERDRLKRECEALRLVQIQAIELVGEADANRYISQADLDALRALLWRVSIKQGRRPPR